VIALRLLGGGAVVREAVVGGARVTIGRAPESDFVLVDGTVSRRHALVHTDEQGEVWIEDANSRHGLWVEGVRVPRARLSAAGPLRCRVGSVELELALASGADTQEIPVAAVAARPRNAPVLWLAGVAAGGVAVLLDPEFWSPWAPDRSTVLLGFILGLAISLPVLAFVLVGIFRIVGRKVLVSQSLRALALVCWGSVLVRLTLEASAYALSVRVHGMLSVLLQVVATAVIVAGVACVARPGPRRRFFATWAAAVTILMAAVGAYGALAARQAGMPEVDYTVPAPLLGLTGPTAGLESYLRVVGEDFAAAEARAADELRRSEGGTGAPSR
jgi:hypothetical protein